MGIEHKLPTDLLKQDPTTGNYKLGGIEMTPAEYALASSINEIKDEIVSLKERVSKVEGK